MKKSHWISFFALFLCCGMLFSSFFDGLEGRFLSLAASNGEKNSPVILIDAGHGGEDGGATGQNGVPEKDLNLSVSMMLADLLRGAGYTVVQTRTEDRLLYDAGTKKGHKKQGDLENRVKYTEKYPNSILVSIHMNTFPTPNCEGTQVWYSQNDARSAALAKRIQDGVKEHLQPENNRKIKAATSSIYLLRHASVPAVLVECGFLSTPTECERLYQD
jgi:N-acetylmuramoyl-L-alanine amidase